MSGPAFDDPFQEDDDLSEEGLLASPRACRECGCTDDDACIGKDGEPCHWVAPDLCSACAAK